MSLSEPDVDWSFAPDEDKEVDFKRSYGLNIDGFKWFRHEAIIMICIEEASYESGVYITPSFYEPWQTEIIQVNAVMKCWGRGLSLGRG